MCDGSFLHALQLNFSFGISPCWFFLFFQIRSSKWWPTPSASMICKPFERSSTPSSWIRWSRQRESSTAGTQGLIWFRCSCCHFCSCGRMLNCNCELDGCYVMLNVELDAIVNWKLYQLSVMYILNVEDLLPVSCDVSAWISVLVWQMS